MVQVRAVHVAAAEDERGTHVALVAEEHPFEQGHGRHHARLHARVQSVELELGGGRGGVAWWGE